ncbi:adenosylcobinamide amidohydrolase [Oxyplasma meridianum]|uniref:Adenosylcobinamide amidohydrolase n=1 Tax=Oxyplasma meridianum TaxID=3073602 RepID=A0AAX4NFV0_9ARCH
MGFISNRYCKYGNGEKFYFLKFNEPVDAISSAPFNGGFKKIEMYINRQVPIEYNYDPVEEIGSFLDQEGLPKEKCLVTITACNIEKAYLKQFSDSGIFILASITACFGNALSIGGDGLISPGTINIAVFTDYGLSAAGGLNLFQSIVEAKSQALNDFQIRDKTTGRISPGTSTDTTSLFLIPARGGDNYGGRLTEIGKKISMTVYNGLEEMCSNSDGH